MEGHTMDANKYYCRQCGSVTEWYRTSKLTYDRDTTEFKVIGDGVDKKFELIKKTQFPKINIVVGNRLDRPDRIDNVDLVKMAVDDLIILHKGTPITGEFSHPDRDTDLTRICKVDYSRAAITTSIVGVNDFGEIIGIVDVFSRKALGIIGDMNFDVGLRSIRIPDEKGSPSECRFVTFDMIWPTAIAAEAL
jgi:hypothetical protein